jgi:hypothetical protein
MKASALVAMPTIPDIIDSPIIPFQTELDNFWVSALNGFSLEGMPEPWSANAE